jgi:hypothetical protein
MNKQTVHIEKYFSIYVKMVQTYIIFTEGYIDKNIVDRYKDTNPSCRLLQKPREQWFKDIKMDKRRLSELYTHYLIWSQVKSRTIIVTVRLNEIKDYTVDEVDARNLIENVSSAEVSVDEYVQKMSNVYLVADFNTFKSGFIAGILITFILILLILSVVTVKIIGKYYLGFGKNYRTINTMDEYILNRLNV